MLRSILTRACFSLTPQSIKNIPLSIEQINQCRKLLNMSPSIKSSLADSYDQYLTDRSKNHIDRNNCNPDEIIARWEEVRPIDCEMSILATAKQLSKREKYYINGMIKFWGMFFLIFKPKFQKAGQKRWKQFKRALEDYVKVFNQLIYLMPKEEATVILYLKIFTKAEELRLIKDQNCTQLKYIFDQILTLKIASQRNINYLLYFVTRYQPSLFYHDRQRQIMEYVYTQLPSNFQSLENDTAIKNILYCANRAHYTPQTILDRLPQLLAHSNIQHRFQAFLCMLQNYQITKNNIQQQNYKKLIKQFVNKNDIRLFASLARQFYRTDIWIEDFWIPYFKFMSEEDNHTKITKIDHHIIDDLLIENGDGEKTLKKIALQFRQFLKSKGIDIVNINIKEETESIYGQAKKSKFTIQQQIVNTFKLLGQVEVLTQVTVKYFLVDILIDKKIVIELNNLHHYKEINGEYKLNTKSQFRERILKREGYLYHNVKTGDFVNSNYSMLHTIQQMVNQYLEIQKSQTSKMV